MSGPLTTFTTPTGEELVVITRAEYDRLITGLDDVEAAEDAGTAHIVRTTDAAIAAGEDVAIPETVWEAIETGASPLLVLRNWRDMTQMHLEHRTGFSQSFLSQIETGAKKPSFEALKELARALKVPLGVLAEAYGREGH